MSESTVESVLIPEPATNDAALVAVYRQNADLVEQVNSLQEQVRKYADKMDEAQKESVRKLDRTAVRNQIIGLAGELTSEDAEDFSSETITAVNEVLDNLGLETIVKKFTLSVRVFVSQVVEIDVEAESLEAATDAVEGGDYDSELLDELDAGSFAVEEYRDVEEA